MKDIANTLYHLKTIQSLGTYLLIGQIDKCVKALFKEDLHNHFDTGEVQEHTRRLDELVTFLQSDEIRTKDIDYVVFNLRTIQTLGGHLILVQEGQTLDVHIDAYFNEEFQGHELQVQLCRIEYLSIFLKSL